MRLSESGIDDIERVLFSGLEYGEECADLIMVLGSKRACDYRVPKARELFLSGRANRILLCGGRVQKTTFGEMAEWQAMSMALNDLPSESVFFEKNSMYTAANFELAKPIIEKMSPEPKRILLVTADFHMRRAILLAHRILPGYEFLPCPVSKGSACRDRFRLSQRGMSRAIAEVQKLVMYAKEGLIDDIEI